MLKTRDLVIFVAVLLILCIGIAVTLLFERINGNSEGPFISFNTDIIDTYSAEAPRETINRQDIISRLQNALEHNESSVEPSPSVEEEEVIEAPDESEEEPGTGIQRCGGNDSAMLTGIWPLSGVSIVTEGGSRKVVHSDGASVVDVNASSSSSVSSKARTLLVMPLAPYADGQQHCVPGDAVGVTTSGSLMFNSDAAFYRGYGSEYLIGYARDGFPIYGYYEGTLDSCGGYMHPSGYRYSVSAQGDHLINCYAASPASFSAQ